MRALGPLFLLAVTAAGALPTVAAMRHHRRVLIVAAPSAGDRHLAEQREAVDGWRRGADERDVTMVTLVGSEVSGAADAAATLRREWRLPADRFGVVLVGKDGHEALRSATPLSAERLEGAIDAMPMRRAGLR